MNAKVKNTKIALLTWAILILTLSVIRVPQPPFKAGFVLSDTAYHALFYMPLGALIVLSFPVAGKATAWARGAVIGFGYGFAIELLQAALPWRSFELSDGAADLVGSMVGALAGIAILVRQNSHASRERSDAPDASP